MCLFVLVWLDRVFVIYICIYIQNCRLWQQVDIEVSNTGELENNSRDIEKNFLAVGDFRIIERKIKHNLTNAIEKT